MMFELADYAAFIVATFGGVVIGRRMRPRPPEPIKPVCTCEHGLGFHEDGLRCHAIDHEYLSFDRYEERPCLCRRYDGPDPATIGLDAS